MKLACFAVVVALCDGADEATPSPLAVVMYPSVARSEVEDAVDACAARVVFGIDESGEAVEPSVSYVDEWPPAIDTVVEKLVTSVGLVALDVIVKEPRVVD